MPTNEYLMSLRMVTPGMEAAIADTRQLGDQIDMTEAAAMRMSGAMGTASNRAHSLGAQMNKANQHTANMYAQFNDIGVMLAAGQNPFQLALQQGTQINQVLAQMGGGTKALAGVAVALRNVFSPLNLGVIAFIAAAGVAVQAARKWAGATDDFTTTAKNAAEALKELDAASKKTDLSTKALVESYGVADASFRRVLTQLAELKRQDAFEAMKEDVSAIADIIDYRWNFKARTGDFGEVLGISTVLQGDISDWKAARAEVQGIADILDQSINADNLDDMYTAALKFNEKLAEAADISHYSEERQERIRDRRREITEALGQALVRMREMGAIDNRRSESLAHQVNLWRTMYEDTRQAAIEEYNAAQSMLAAYEDKTRLAEIALGYGKDSAEYAKELRQQELAIAKAAAESATNNERARQALVEAHMAAYDTAIAAEKAAEEEKKFADAVERSQKALEKAAEEARERQEAMEATLTSLEREMAVNQAILDYGEGSVQHLQAKRAAYEEATKAAYEEKGYHEESLAALVAAEMAAYDLAAAVSKSADEAKRFSRNMRGYDDGTGPGTGNAGDGYAGVTGGSWFDQPSTMPTMSFKIYVPDERPLEEYFTFVEAGIKDLDKELNAFVRENSGAINNAILSGGADPMSFWKSFRTLAIDSYGSILEELFSDSGAATNFIAKSLENVLNANISAINANIENFNEAVRNIDVSDAIRRSADGMSLSIDLNKFRKMEAGYFNTTRELIGSALTGQLGGGDGNRTWANLKTFFENTKSKTWFDNNGEEHTSTVKFTDREIKKLGAVGKVFGNIVGDIQDKIVMFSEVVGGRVDGFGSIMHKFNIDLGKDAKAGGKLSKLVLQEFEDYSDKLAKRALKGRDDLQRAGESWTDTLERLADDFLGVSSTLAFMGSKQLQKATLNNADFASELANLFGGVEALNESAMAFFNIAYSPGQQQDSIDQYVRDTLEAAGIKRMPKTRQALQDMVEGLDLTSKRGREKWAVLVELADLFDMILPAWEEVNDATNNAKNNTDEPLRWIGEMISEAQKAEGTFRRLAESLAATADQVRASGQAEDRRLEVLQREFDILYARGMSGDLDALEKVGGTAQEYVDLYGKFATTAADYEFMAAVTANKLDDLAGAAELGAELSAYQVEQLQKLEEQVETGKITAYRVQKVVDAVGGLDTRLYQAINKLYKAQTGGKSLNGNNPSGTVTVNGAGLQNGTINFSTVSSNGSGSGGSQNVDVYTKSETDRLLEKVVKELRTNVRVSRNGVKWGKRTARTLEDWDADWPGAT